MCICQVANARVREKVNAWYIPFKPDLSCEVVEQLLFLMSVQDLADLALLESHLVGSRLLVMFWVLKPGSTVKSTPALSQLRVTHRFDNPAFCAIIQAFDENIKENKTE